MSFNQTVLVIDDSSVVRAVLKDHLARIQNLRVLEAEDGLKGLETLARENVDLIIADIIMPNLDGIELTKKLRAHHIYKDIPIIILTTRKELRDKVVLLNTGANDYLEKPVAPIELIARVNSILKVKSLQDELKKRTKSLEKANKEMESLLTNMVGGVIMTDNQGVVKVINPYAKKLLGLSEDVSYSNKEFLKNKLGVNPVKILQENEQDVLKREVSIFGRTYQIIASAIRDESKALVGTVLIFLDITQEKELEELKTDFMTMIVHDLKAPMTVIKGGTELVLSELANTITENQKAVFLDIRTASNRVISLIEDFLDLAKLRSQRITLKLHPLDVSELILRALMDVHLLTQKKNLKLVHKIEENLPPALAEAEKLERVLVNLLSNAIKFTPESGQIEVHARLAEQASDPDNSKRKFIQIDIRDTGPGIDPEEKEFIFEMYRQTKMGKSSEHKGTGLGLAICKMIIDAHGGKIWVDSKPGKGSTFSFVIPVVEREGVV